MAIKSALISRNNDVQSYSVGVFGDNLQTHKQESEERNRSQN